MNNVCHTYIHTINNFIHNHKFAINELIKNYNVLFIINFYLNN